MKTLENITAELQKKSIPESEVENTLSTAMMLAFVEATHAVINNTTMPTPLYRLKYDKETSNVDFQQLNGRSQVPEADALDINMLDLLTSALLREKMPLLLEGKTGVGKTFTIEQFCKTVFTRENYRPLRLNTNMSNVLQPYTEGRLENGLLKIGLRNDELDRIAFLLVDEANRGDTNQILQLQDGYVRLPTGEGGEIGVPIPHYKDGKWTASRDNKRPLFVVSAQNPPATKDAKYSATRRTDAAQNNRNLQIDVPNGATDIGSAVLQLDSGNGQHKKFLSHYQRILAGYLGVEESCLSTLKDDWIDVYAFSTDPHKTACPSLRSAVEFMDSMLLLVSPQLKDTFEHDKNTSRVWNNTLNAYAVDWSYSGTIDETSQAMEKIRKIVNSFEEEIVTRDIIKAKKMSDAVSLTRRIKMALSENDPLATYRQIPNFITVQDVACGMVIVLYDKQDKHDDDPVTLIDVALKEYTKITKDYADKIAYRWKTTDAAGKISNAFPLTDTNMSVYTLALGRALRNSSPGIVAKAKATVTGRSDLHVVSFIKDIGASVGELKRLSGGTEESKPILARMVADLSTLAGYANQYSAQLEPILAKTDATERRTEFMNFYQQQRKRSSFSDIYLVRLTRVLGA